MSKEEKEFNLSEKIRSKGHTLSDDFIFEEDVKEFIRRLKEELCYEMTDKDSSRGNMDGISQGMIWEEIDKLAGEKLI